MSQPEPEQSPGAASISLSTASVYPESTADAFEMAARLGYDGVEVMVGIDEISQDIRAVEQLSDYHRMPVVAIHAPTLLITQRVWGTEPWGKLRRSVEMARRVGAEAIVVHPPFRWQRDYARRFIEGIAELEADSGIALCIENMYPWRTPRRELQAYAPGWDPVEQPYANVTLDLSHTASAHVDPLAMAHALGPRLRHVHMTDGTGSAKDEHLVPGRGGQSCGQFLEHLAAVRFDGHVVIEINTRRSDGREGRELDLMESLAFTRLHLATAPTVDGTGGGTRAPA